jgi:hypothetical protein
MDRARKELTWDAQDGLHMACKALERLTLDFKEEGAREAWDQVLDAWWTVQELTEAMEVRRCAGRSGR